MTLPAQQLERHLNQQLGRVVFGMDDAASHLAVALVTGGHILVEGVPGLGKTLLAKSFSELIGGEFRRVQCTADMMPSDITGVHIYRAPAGEFELVPGPLFADVLLVDEINRTGPKTQSSLLQAMEERRVTIDRTTYPLPEGFMVIASQNPADFEGTYPLPESQIDRFLLRLQLDYPKAAVEQQVLMAYDRTGGGHEGDIELEPLPDGLLEAAREHARAVDTAEPVYRYVTAIAEASRRHPRIDLGLSTRGALNLMRCARVQAAIEGADYVLPDHVKRIAPAVVAHRLVLAPDAALEGIEASDVTRDLLDQVEVPRA